MELEDVGFRGGGRGLACNGRGVVGGGGYMLIKLIMISHKALLF